jgi:uncharacterized protein (UPF0332 family)
MHGRDFLHLAQSLLSGSTEAEWRSAVSRAYYAAFHVARDLLLHCQFAVPRGEQAHGYLWLRLSNASAAAVIAAGRDLKSVRSSRNWADYDLGSPVVQLTAMAQVQIASNVIRILEAARQDPVKTQITDAMKIYERDVLKTVTWHP